MDITKKNLPAFFDIFQNLSEIPRGSGNCKKAAEFIVRFAKEKGFAVKTDKFCNVSVTVPASRNSSGKTVALQGHIDMVAAKEKDSKHDFSVDPIKPVIMGNKLTANGTTLGADDGIAVAYMLALLSEDFKHPKLELIFTTDEETGMDGAEGMAPEFFSSDMLINLDSEEEGMITVGCAGGTTASIDAVFPADTYSGSAYKVSLKGFAGGHSGVEIGKSRKNAVISLAKILSGKNLRIVAFSGGEKLNCIPSFSEAVIICDETEIKRIKRSFSHLSARYKGDDDHPVLQIESISVKNKKVLDKENSERLINMLIKVKNGVISYSKDVPGAVETSLNLGVVSLSNGVFNGISFIRSNDNNGMPAVFDSVKKCSKRYGFTANVISKNLPWQYREKSLLRETAVKVYRKLYGTDPKTNIIHAGLECGIFVSKKPTLDCISIGPDITDVHSPNEALDIPSAVRTYEFIKEILSEL